VLEIVVVPELALPLFLPLLLKHILDAVFGGSGLVGDGAVVDLGFVDQAIQQGTFIAAGLVRVYQQGLPFEALSGAVQVVAGSLHLFLVDKEHYFVEVLSGLDIVESSHNDGELSVEGIRHFLHFALVGVDLKAWTPLAHELGNYVCFMPPNVLLSEHELPIEVCVVNCVHVNQVDLPDSAEGQVLDDFAAQSARAHHQYGSGRYCLKVFSGVEPVFLEGGRVS